MNSLFWFCPYKLRCFSVVSLRPCIPLCTLRPSLPLLLFSLSKNALIFKYFFFGKLMTQNKNSLRGCSRLLLILQLCRLKQLGFSVLLVTQHTDAVRVLAVDRCINKPTSYQYNQCAPFISTHSMLTNNYRCLLLTRYSSCFALCNHEFVI